MIVKDSSNPRLADSKSNYAPVSARGTGETSCNAESISPSPPAYVMSQNPFMNYRPGAESAGRRFWRAFAVAIIIWFLLSLFIHSIVEMALVHRNRKHGGPAKDYPEFDTGEVIQCIDHPDWLFSNTASNETDMAFYWDPSRPPLHSSTSFSLPANSDLLYFLSRGSLASGYVHVKYGSGSSANDDTVRVDVGVWYWAADALDHASVCALERHDNSDHYGVGIFTPHSWPGRSARERLHFEVVVNLPPRTYPALETDYENFMLHIDDLHKEQGSVLFEKLHLKTSNGQIYAENLVAHEASLKSSNGNISGKYNVTSSLQLVTSNARIDASVDMYSENSHTTSLLLKTSNGYIDSKVDLYGPPHTSAFDVRAYTSNAPLTIQIPTHTHTTPLTIELRTSNARARALLHPSFEGPFSLRTSNAAPVLVTTPGGGGPGVEDPSGQGRPRKVDVARRVRGVLEGKVWWGEWTSREKGWVHVWSSNAPVELDLTGSGGFA